MHARSSTYLSLYLSFLPICNLSLSSPLERHAGTPAEAAAAAVAATETHPGNNGLPLLAFHSSPLCAADPRRGPSVSGCIATTSNAYTPIGPVQRAPASEKAIGHYFSRSLLCTPPCISFFVVPFSRKPNPWCAVADNHVDFVNLSLPAWRRGSQWDGLSGWRNA